MIYLYELINPLYRDISIEDHGHPYFIISAEKYKNQSVFHMEQVSESFQKIVDKYETIAELVDGVIAWPDDQPYKTALINELTREV